MSFLDKFIKRKKKETEGGAEVKKSAERVETRQELKRPEGAGDFLTGILLSARLTEKTSNMTGDFKYTFIVDKNANKIEIRRAVEEKYGVGVETVKILNMPGKERRRGRQVGWKSGFKKAVVKIREGNTIEIQ